MLPDICRAAYGGDVPKTLSIWGIPIDPTDPASDARVSVVLMRFLRAKKLDVTATRTLLVEVLRWRQEIHVDELVKRDFVAPWSSTVAFGKDKAGRSVIYNHFDVQTIRHFRKELDTGSKTVILRAARNSEKISRSLNYETVDQVVHVTEYGPDALAELHHHPFTNATLTTIIMDYYPNLPAHSFLLNTPARMSVLSRIRAFMAPPAVCTRVHHIAASSTEAIGRKLLPYIDADELPVRYGGKAEGFAWPDRARTAPGSSSNGALDEKKVC